MRRRRGRGKGNREDPKPNREVPAPRQNRAIVERRQPAQAHDALQSLPHPLLKEILGYLAAKDLCQAAATSQTFEAATAENTLWHSFLYTDFVVAGVPWQSPAQTFAPQHFKSMYSSRYLEHVETVRRHRQEQEHADRQAARVRLRSMRSQHCVLNMMPESLLLRMTPEDFKVLLMCIYSVLVVVASTLLYLARRLIVGILLGIVVLAVMGVVWWIPVGARIIVALSPLVLLLMHLNREFNYVGRPRALLLPATVISIVAEFAWKPSPPLRVVVFLFRLVHLQKLSFLGFPLATFALVRLGQRNRRAATLPAAMAAVCFAIRMLYWIFHWKSTPYLVYAAVWALRVLGTFFSGMFTFVSVSMLVCRRQRRGRPWEALLALMAVIAGLLFLEFVVAKWLLNRPIWLYSVGMVWRGFLHILRTVGIVVASVVIPFAYGALAGRFIRLPWSHQLPQDSGFIVFLLVLTSAIGAILAVIFGVGTLSGLGDADVVWQYFELTPPEFGAWPPLEHTAPCPVLPFPQALYMSPLA